MGQHQRELGAAVAGAANLNPAIQPEDLETISDLVVARMDEAVRFEVQAVVDHFRQHMRMLIGSEGWRRKCWPY